MNKFYVAVFAVMLAVLGGCATNGGDVIGTGAIDAGPRPPGVDVQAAG